MKRERGPAVPEFPEQLAPPCDPLELSTRHPDWSAKTPLTCGQKVFSALLVVALVAGFVYAPAGTGRVIVAVTTLFYLASVCYRLLLLHASTRPGASLDFQVAADAQGGDTAGGATEGEWPVYSLLVPMYKEPETLPLMAQALASLDYPQDRLDVQLLLEEDDGETLAAARRQGIPLFYPGRGEAPPEKVCLHATVVPPSFPRTKPKACNIGLHYARGEFLVIYDAEDRPEPDQLKKAVLAFRSSPADVACIQSRLNYFNPRHNLLTRWFSADYSAWFDLSLPGLAALRAVIPLGGTSNHFRTAVLRDLMGWDAYNVTEDCDLGVRLARAGYGTRMLNSTTWEEACSSPKFWIRQRTRWQKGYIQTFMVHTRHPFRLVREIGLFNTLQFFLLVGGSVFASLANPFFWIMALVWLLFRPAGVDALFPGWVFALSAICLFAGNFVFFYINLLGCYCRKRDDLMWANLLTPLYWAMMSISAWRAAAQFFTNPFHWEKTQHGLSS